MCRWNIRTENIGISFWDLVKSFLSEALIKPALASLSPIMCFPVFKEKSLLEVLLEIKSSELSKNRSSKTKWAFLFLALKKKAIGSSKNRNEKFEKINRLEGKIPSLSKDRKKIGFK